MKKRYWILEGLYTIEMVMVEQMYFDYLHEWWYRDDNYYSYANAAVGYSYDTTQHLTIGYERALVRIPCNRFKAQKVELMLYLSGKTKLDFDIKVYEITQDFDIRNVTWNTQPPHGDLIATKHVTDEDFPGWVSIDITQSLLSWFDRHQNPPAYKLIAGDEGVTYDILEEASFETERGVEDWRPKLNIIF